MCVRECVLQPWPLMAGLWQWPFVSFMVSSGWALIFSSELQSYLLQVVLLPPVFPQAVICWSVFRSQRSATQLMTVYATDIFYDCRTVKMHIELLQGHWCWSFQPFRRQKLGNVWWLQILFSIASSFCNLKCTVTIIMFRLDLTVCHHLVKEVGRTCCVSLLYSRNLVTSNLSLLNVAHLLWAPASFNLSINRQKNMTRKKGFEQFDNNQMC